VIELQCFRFSKEGNLTEGLPRRWRLRASASRSRQRPPAHATGLCPYRNTKDTVGSLLAGPIDPLQVVRQRVQLVHVVRRRVAGVAEDPQLTLAYLAKLLRLHRPPLKRRPAVEAQFFEEVVRRFGRTGERPREDLGVRDD